MTNGLVHPYHLGNSTSIHFRGSKNEFFLSFIDENPLSKQNNPRQDAAFCGVTAGVMLFARKDLTKDM